METTGRSGYWDSSHGPSRRWLLGGDHKPWSQSTVATGRRPHERLVVAARRRLLPDSWEETTRRVASDCGTTRRVASDWETTRRVASDWETTSEANRRGSSWSPPTSPQ